jgi:predicted CoA-substrate-specific enzyme activase
LITAGIDIGSRTVKVVVLDTAFPGLLRHSSVADVSTDAGSDADRAFSQALASCALRRSDIASALATGYGRDSASFADDTSTEIICHAAGVSAIFPQARLVIDIGGQDSKVIRISENGKVLDFAMNDRCAAGTGRFLEVAARILGTDVSRMAALASEAGEVPEISSMCAVFAESEVLGMLAKGARTPDIAAGLHAALARRAGALARRCGLASPIVFTGGVARDKAMVDALSSELGEPISVPPDPRITGALGAAIIAARRLGSNERLNVTITPSLPDTERKADTQDVRRFSASAGAIEIHVTDLGIAREFWVSKLGFIPSQETERAIQLPLSNGVFLLLYKVEGGTAPDPCGPGTVAILFVSGIDKLVAEWQAKGVEFVRVPWSREDSGIGPCPFGRFIGLKDPFGNYFEILEPKESKDV